MVKGGYITLDFSELELSLVKPTSSQATTIDLTKYPNLKNQWNHLDRGKGVFIYDLWVESAYNSGFATLSILNKVPSVHFDCPQGTYEITVADNTMTITLG